MNIRYYYERKQELEYLIAFNERIHCPRVAEKWRRELYRLEQQYKKNESNDNNKGLCEKP